MPLFEVMDSTKALMDAAKITKRSLKELLRDNQIDTDEALGIVSAIAHCGDSDAIKLRAAEMALKMSGDLEETAVKQIPVVNIIINDTQKVDINPILIPRNA